jgi:2-hydroxychromene-2-carboxylate isomerase
MNDVLKALAKGVGLDTLMRSRGLSPAQIDACLSDAVAQKQVVAMSNEAWTVRKINGTPSFLINGSAFEGPGSWAAVEAGLKAALAAK